MAKRRGRRKTETAPGRLPPAPDDSTAVDRWRPWLLAGLIALFVARPLFAGESAVLGDGMPVVMLWIALAVLWLLGALGRRSFTLRFRGADGALLLLVVLHTASALWAVQRASPRPAVNLLWEWVGMGLSFLLARQLLVGRREAKAALAVMFCLAVAISGYGLYQYFYQFPQMRADFMRDPDAALRASGMWYEPGSRDRELFAMRLESPAPLATFALTNSLAGYLAPWLVIAAGIAVGARRENRWPTRLAVGLCAWPVAGCLVLTKSRSAWGAALLGLVLVGWFCLPKKTRVGWKLPAGLAVLLGAAAVAIVAAAKIDVRLLTEAPKSLGYRWQYWQSTWSMIADRPLWGCGPGNFQPAYTQYMLPEASEEVADPHNFVLEVWATAGTPSLLALLTLLGLFAYRVLGHSPPEENESAPPQRAKLSEERDLPYHVLLGGACGFLLSMPLGVMSAAPPGPLPVLLGLPLAVAAGWLLRRWVEGDDPLPAVLPAIGVVVLLIHLSAAGALGFPSVSGSLWLLLAVGLNVGDASHAWRMPRRAAVVGLAAMLALAFACYRTAYLPVLRCSGNLERAREQPWLAVGHLRAAAEADPLSAAPWRELASLARGRLARGDATAYDDFRSAMDEAVARSPNSASTWNSYGEGCWIAFERAGHASALPDAIRAFRRAVDLYPNSSRLHAQLARALRASGDWPAFDEHARRAIQLDDLNVHPDKRLPEALRDELVEGLGRNGRKAG
jgi:O-antigen ligase